jgi:hypothetical protein
MTERRDRARTLTPRTLTPRTLTPRTLTPRTLTPRTLTPRTLTLTALTLSALTLLAALVLLVSCGAPHPGLSNGSVSACYRAIPAARAVVSDSRATVIGVHRVPADSVVANLPPAAQAQLAGDDDTSVCTIAFKGTFPRGQAQSTPAPQGRYALVVVTTRGLHVLASAVLDELPRSLGKRTL